MWRKWEIACISLLLARWYNNTPNDLYTGWVFHKESSISHAIYLIKASCQWILTQQIYSSSNISPTWGTGNLVVSILGFSRRQPRSLHLMRIFKTRLIFCKIKTMMLVHISQVFIELINWWFSLGRNSLLYNLIFLKNYKLFISRYSQVTNEFLKDIIHLHFE